MLFKVIERFKCETGLIGERFRQKGRMLPEGVPYHANWVDLPAVRWFQLMEAPDSESLMPWIRCWSDLMDRNHSGTDF
jgi:Protein of unknown function (DUF3303)